MRQSRPKLQSFTCWLVLSLFCITAYGQVWNQNLFAPVPAPLRARLVERLKLLVEYQRTQNWGAQYDLLSSAVTQGDSKEEHVKRLQHSYAEGYGDPLIDFTPKSVRYIKGAPFDAIIFGCAKLREKKRTVELNASVEAYREQDDWYFSPVSVITPVGGKPEPCRHPSATTHPSTPSAGPR